MVPERGWRKTPRLDGLAASSALVRANQQCGVSRNDVCKNVCGALQSCVRTDERAVDLIGDHAVIRVGIPFRAADLAAGGNLDQLVLRLQMNVVAADKRRLVDDQW